MHKKINDTQDDVGTRVDLLAESGLSLAAADVEPRLAIDTASKMEGPQGAPGASGAAGATGAQGATGDAGDQGATGVTGASDAADGQGTKGDVGAPSIQGEAGANAKGGHFFVKPSIKEPGMSQPCTRIRD